MKKMSLYKINFPEPYSHSKKKKKVELDWIKSNYATKSDLKNATGVDTLNFA